MWDEMQRKVVAILSSSTLTTFKIDNFLQVLEKANTVRSIRFDSIRFDSIPFDSIRFDSIPFDSIRFDSIPFDSIPFYSIDSTNLANEPLSLL